MSITLLNTTDSHQKTTYHGEPATIEIQTLGPDNEKTWRVAMLSCNPNSDINMISPKLVANTLGVSLQPPDKQDTSYGHGRKGAEEVEGFVDLTWRFEMRSVTPYKMRFFVTSNDDPPYDAVLGEKDAKHVGML